MGTHNDPFSESGSVGSPLPGDAFPSTETNPPVAFSMGRYLRWAIWLSLLVGAISLWTFSYLQPDFSDRLAQWIAQWSHTPLSQAQLDAEQAAAKHLRNSGALVIFEGPQQGVTSVHITSPDVLTEENLEQLAWLVRLNSLNLTGMPITDQQIPHIAKVRSLASLVLNQTPIADTGLAHLAPLEQLEVLHLRKTAVTDAGLVHLTALPNLKVLDLSETQITDAGLAELAHLKNLRWLLLNSTKVTDAGLVHLEKLPQLSQLNLQYTPVTQEGIARLKKAFPSLHVDWQAPSAPKTGL